MRDEIWEMRERERDEIWEMRERERERERRCNRQARLRLDKLHCTYNIYI